MSKQTFKAEMRVGCRVMPGELIIGKSSPTDSRFFWKFSYKLEGVTTEKMGIAIDGIGSFEGAEANAKAKGVIILEKD